MYFLVITGHHIEKLRVRTEESLSHVDDDVNVIVYFRDIVI